MTPQSAKAKGRKFQQLIVLDLLNTFPELDFDDVQSRSMGAGGEDIVLSPLAQRVIGLSFEAKAQEKLNIWAALKQAESNSGDRPGVVVFKRNRSDVYVALRWLDFLEILQRGANDTGLPDITLRELVDLMKSVSEGTKGTTET